VFKEGKKKRKKKKKKKKKLMLGHSQRKMVDTTVNQV